jgi:hypothetical protein
MGYTFDMVLKLFWPISCQNFEMFYLPTLLVLTQQLFSLSDRKPSGHWTKDGNNIRELLEEFAKSKKFDPLIAENWYSISNREFLEFKVTDVFELT